MKSLTPVTAMVLMTMSSLSWAQSGTDRSEQKEVPAATQPKPPAGQPGMGSSQGMMGSGGMMNMMGGNMPMMDMMKMMMQHSGGGMGGMATIDHVEGRIAFLRTELKITDAQTGAWSAFADALRANAKSLGEVRASMMAGATPQTLLDRLTLQEKWLAARLEGTRAIKSALTNLVGTFSDEQKKMADELLGPHMGITMAMMSAMKSGQMGPGQMQPGKMMPGR